MNNKTKLFGLLLATFTAVSLASCAKPKHVHNPGTTYGNNEVEHWITCTDCGEIVSKENHTFDQTVVNEKYLATSATCTARATYYKSCVCGLAGSEKFEAGELAPHTYTNNYGHTSTKHWLICDDCHAEGEKVSHIYNKEVANETYLVSSATCSRGAIYYKSCICGEAGTDTFEYGSPINHTPDNIYENNSTSHWMHCEECGDVLNEENHTYDRRVYLDKYLASNATCTQPAKYYYSCICGRKGTSTFEHGDVLEHVSNGVYTHNDEGHSSTCKDCGAALANQPHDYSETFVSTATSNYIRQVCKECGYTRDVKPNSTNSYSYESAKTASLSENGIINIIKTALDNEKTTYSVGLPSLTEDREASIRVFEEYKYVGHNELSETSIRIVLRRNPESLRYLFTNYAIGEFEGFEIDAAICDIGRNYIEWMTVEHTANAAKLYIDEVVVEEGRGTTACGDVLDGTFTLAQRVNIYDTEGKFAFSSVITGITVFRKKLESVSAGAKNASLLLRGVDPSQLARGFLITPSSEVASIDEGKAFIRIAPKSEQGKKYAYNHYSPWIIAGKTKVKVQFDWEDNEFFFSKGEIMEVNVTLETPIAGYQGMSFEIYETNLVGYGYFTLVKEADASTLTITESDYKSSDNYYRTLGDTGEEAYINYGDKELVLYDSDGDTGSFIVSQVYYLLNTLNYDDIEIDIYLVADGIQYLAFIYSTWQNYGSCYQEDGVYYLVFAATPQSGNPYFNSKGEWCYEGDEPVRMVIEYYENAGHAM